jgi:hypothetical protein
VAVPRGPRSGGLRRPDRARWNWAGGVLSRRPRSGRGEHRWSLPIGPQRRIRVAQLSPKRGPGPAHRSGPGQGGPPARPRESSARLRRGRLKAYHRADRRNVLHFTESWRARASPSARPMRVARRMATRGFLSRRGYHLTRRSSRRTDGRQRSDGEAPRPSATGEGRPGAASVTTFAADRLSIPTAARPRASTAGRCPLGSRLQPFGGASGTSQKI